MSATKVAKMVSTSSKFTQRGYQVIKPLWTDPMTGRTIQLACRDNKQYVLKPLQEHMFSQAMRSVELNGCQFVRAPVDVVKEEKTIVYEYMTDTLFNLVKHFSLQLSQRKQILFDVLQGLAEMHNRDWVHTDLKPNNVLVDYHKQASSQLIITRVKVGDVDNSVVLKQGQYLNCRVGNLWWRSPEMQLGVSVTKSTDVFSFGLVCIFVILRRPILFIPEELRHPDIPEYLQVLDRMIDYFGFLPSSLREKTSRTLCEMLEYVEGSYANGEPFHLFQDWAEGALPDLGKDIDLSYVDAGFKAMIGKAMKMDPHQ